jgi:hypothetical protein
MRMRRDDFSMAGMARQPHPTLILELEEREVDSIAGRVLNSAGKAIDFIGWLGLAGAIETALHGGRSEADPKPTAAKQTNTGGIKR